MESSTEYVNDVESKSSVLNAIGRSRIKYFIKIVVSNQDSVKFRSLSDMVFPTRESKV